MRERRIMRELERERARERERERERRRMRELERERARERERAKEKECELKKRQSIKPVDARLSVVKPGSIRKVFSRFNRFVEDEEGTMISSIHLRNLSWTRNTIFLVFVEKRNERWVVKTSKNIYFIM